MKKIILFLFVVFLTACAPTSGSNDPNLNLLVAQSQLTGTAQAFEMQIVGWTATAQSWTPTPSLTPAPTATPTITFTPTVDVTGTLAVEQMNLEIQQLNRQNEREEWTNWIVAMKPYVVGFIALLIVMMLFVVLAMRLSHIPTPMHESGKPHPMLNVIDGSWSDIDRATNGAVNLTKRFIALLPNITPDRQDQVTSRAQLVDMKTRSKVTTAAVQKLMESQGVKLLPGTNPNALSAAVQEVQDDLFLLPSWDLIDQWDGQSKPLGLGKTGIITANSASPHILISGKTGSGKTMYMLRTLTLAGLVKGFQVVNIGYSDSGFGVFANHANFHSVQLHKASDIIPCLASVYEELKDRKRIIGGQSIEWEHWPNGAPPRPFVELLMDELGNMAEDIYMNDGAQRCKEMWNWVSMIANEGRKVGIRFVAALQDPTAKSVDLRFRRNCTLVSFQQGDADQSRAFLGTSGAENLKMGHFMVRLNDLTIGGGFSPSDPEIVDYLRRHEVRSVEKPEWIDAQVKAQEQITDQDDARSLPATEAKVVIDERLKLIDEENHILALHAQGMSATNIVYAVWGKGSSLFSERMARVKALTATATVTATAAQPSEMPLNGAITA